MQKTICSMCGKEFSEWDNQEYRCYHDVLGYGSKYDGDVLDVNLCCDCFDDVIDMIRSKCKYDIIKQRS